MLQNLRFPILVADKAKLETIGKQIKEIATISRSNTESKNKVQQVALSNRTPERTQTQQRLI
jgi:hypothetical protein